MFNQIIFVVLMLLIEVASPNELQIIEDTNKALETQILQLTHQLKSKKKELQKT